MLAIGVLYGWETRVKMLRCTMEVALPQKPIVIYTFSKKNGVEMRMTKNDVGVLQADSEQFSGTPKRATHPQNDLLQALHPVNLRESVHPRNVQHREHGADAGDGGKARVHDICPHTSLVGRKADGQERRARTGKKEDKDKNLNRLSLVCSTGPLTRN